MQRLTNRIMTSNSKNRYFDKILNVQYRLHVSFSTENIKKESQINEIPSSKQGFLPQYVYMYLLLIINIQTYISMCYFKCSTHIFQTRSYNF